MKPTRVFELVHSSSGKSKSANRITHWISIVVAACFLYFALRELNWQAFVLTLRNANYAYLPLLVLWGSSSYLIRALRWQVLLDQERKIAALDVFWANMAGYLGNTVLPARAGEVVRAAYIGKLANIQVSFALATGLTERLIDVIALVALGSFALFSTRLLSSTLEAGLKVMGLIGIIGLLAILLLPRIGNVIKNLLARLPVLSDDQKEKVYLIIQSFLTGLASLSSFKRATLFITLTAIIWFMDAVGTVLISQMLSLSVTLLQALVLLAAVGLFSAIPSTPGYVGVYQFAAVLALKPFGFSNAAAVALVLFGQLITLVVVGFWGILAIARFSKSTTESN